MTSGIKISNITPLVLYDSAWIAVVDYSENDDCENESGNEEDDDTESSDVLTDNADIIDNVYPNEVGDILEYPSYNAREEDQDETRKSYIGSLVEQLEMA